MGVSKKKNLGSLIVLAILLILYFIFFKKPSEENKTTRNKKDHREAAFRHQRIYYTKHAQCRMDCRNIDESEVKEILKDGEINYSKSDLKSKPCPKYAVEGNTHDGQHVRIIVGNCNSQASIVTVIDLDNEYECDCK
ncbi:MAG: DUF4258 domain-containing protein [Bacteroidetes bacterium]|nr:DUF4258 domain-containing protein [Bacteroidota bacterium]